MATLDLWYGNKLLHLKKIIKIQGIIRFNENFNDHLLMNDFRNASVILLKKIVDFFLDTRFTPP